MATDDCSTREDAGICNQLLIDALPEITIAITALEEFPEAMQSDKEGNLRGRALRAMYKVFSKVHRAEFHAHRAYCSCVPFELKSIPVDDSEA